MLTVKNVLPDGRETVIEVTEVRKEWQQREDGGKMEVVSGALSNGDGTYVFHEGSVYVMNSSGKTVASYGLFMPTKPPEEITNK